MGDTFGAGGAAAGAAGAAAGTGAWLLARMGPAVPERLGLALADDGPEDPFAWLLACLLRAGEPREARVAAALAALSTAGWAAAGPLAAAGPALVDALAEAGLREPEVRAARVARTAAALEQRFEGSLERLAGGGEPLETVGARLVALGPGLGPGTALRFLRPFRDRWAAADEAPLDPVARDAAVHLGWLDAFDDLDTAPGMLRRRLDDEDAAPPIVRAEDALERLGRAACRRANTKRCPLARECPARGR